MKTVKAYTIEDISKWQMELEELVEKSDSDKKADISLPALQRGFVWRPYQMEALWDSILRGYPIGSLLIANAEGNTAKDLLDGQQRCTTIALGFHDPLIKAEFNLLNIKPKNIPSVWIDLKPLDKNKYGLRFAIRVLTRSHPWGYQLSDHRKPLSKFDQATALAYLRHRCGEDKISFANIEAHYRTPWDAHFPIPLSFLLTIGTEELEQWKKKLKARIMRDLNGIQSKYGLVSYDNLKEEWLDTAFMAIKNAKSLLIPEIEVKQRRLQETDNREFSDKEKNQEQAATLFLRLNSAGTPISGQELIYSLIKASFPEAKQLVEEIGQHYLAPSVVVNLFVRFLRMKMNDFNSYQKQVSLEVFRGYLKNEKFKDALKKLIFSGEAKSLMLDAVNIIKGEGDEIPPILLREVIARNVELLVALFAYLDTYRTVLVAPEKEAIRRSFFHTTLFCNSKDKRTLSPIFFNMLKGNAEAGLSNTWELHWEQLSKQNITLLPLLLKPDHFGKILDIISCKYLADGKHHFYDEAWLKEVFREHNELLEYFPKNLNISENLEDNLEQEKKIESAVAHWIKISRNVFWNRQFLIVAQRAYFNEQFKDYMEFEGIEDSSRPWDWDHIYPDSWVYRKWEISQLVRWLNSTNGNIRALSFNENRSQSNRQSPKQRFENNRFAQQNSFIHPENVQYWLALTNQNQRLKRKTTAEEAFVNAVFKRTENIYRACFDVIFCSAENEK